jgi:soluble lytic murein transglycosylase-like protein
MFKQRLLKAFLINTLLSSVLLLVSLPSQAQKVDPQIRALLLEAVSTSDSFSDRFDAEVWLVDMSARLKRYIKNHQKRINFLKAVHREAIKADLPPEMVIAVIQVESGFNKYAISYVGARGLMQVMPFWQKEIGRPDDNMMDLDTNLRYGCTILKHYLDREKGNWTRALARYNGSLGKTWYPERVMNAWKKHWFIQN